MGEYVIFADIPYEGYVIVFEGNENECVRWLKGQKNYKLDDLLIFETTHLDVYEMFGRASW